MRLELGRTTDRRPPFKYSALTRVGFSDTDAQGIVYYGRYLPYFDLSRTEYLRHLDLLNRGRDGEFVMRAMTSSTSRRRGSTTRSRCSAARSASAGRAAPSSAPRTVSRTTR